MMKRLPIYLLLLTTLGFNAQAKDEDWVYTTRPGDTLWNISKNYLKNTGYWLKLQKHNKIKNPRLLPPGSRLLIPIKWLKQQPAPAVVISVSGDAHVNLGDSKVSSPLKTGMKLPIQSKIVTDSGATIVLEFADDSRLTIKQNTVVLLNRLTAHKSNGMVDTRMRLQRGRVETHVIPFKNSDSRFEITTPAAVASVRGTKFRVNMNPDSATMHSQVLAGEIAVASQGITQIVPTGFGIKTEIGKAPQPPKPLLTAVDLSRSQSVFITSKIDISWPPILHAKNYHIEIASGNQFFDILHEIYVLTPSISWQSQEKGRFSLRVRAIDNTGSEGLDAIHLFSVIKDFPPPILTSPQNNAKINSQEISFHWYGASDVKHFHLQVSSNIRFDDTVIEVVGNQQHYTSHKTLIDGKYFWRVANSYPKGVIGKYSDAFHFSINTQP